MRVATLRDLLEHARGSAGGRVSFADDDGGLGTLDVATLADESERIARVLAPDAPAGGLVVLALAEPRDFLPAFWACQTRGLVPVPLAPPLDDVAPFTRAWEAWGRPPVVTDARLVVKAPSALARVAQVGRDLRDGAPGLAQGASALASRPPRPLRSVAPLASSPAAPSRRSDDVALVQPSSGTTGRPRGVQLSHGNLLENVRQIADRLALAPSDTVLSWMPLFHDMGLIATHLASLAAGAHQVWMTPSAFFRRPDVWLRLAGETRATILTGTNTSLRLLGRRLDDDALLGADLSAVRRFLVGAEPISPRVLREAERRLSRAGLRAGALGGSYGLAEASVGVALEGEMRAARVHRLAREALATVGAAVVATEDDASAVEVLEIGRPLDDVELRVADDSGAPLPPMHVGHVEVRGPNVTRGYLLDDDATRAARRDDGFWRTGDLGFLSPDGALTVCGRVKELLFAGGRNLYAEDVESVACEVAGVKRAVAAWATDDDGNAVQGLFLVVDEGAEVHEAVARAREHVTRRTGLALDVVAPIEARAIPRTTSGKVQRGRLGARLLQARARVTTSTTEPREASLPTTREEWQALVRRAWADVLGRAYEDVPLDETFASLGGSSIAALEVQGRLERALGVPLDHEVLLSSPTVSTLAARLSASLRATPTHARVRARRPDDDEPIAIVGHACRLPLGDSPDAFWSALLEGRSAVRPAPADRWRRTDAADLPHAQGSWLDDPWAFDATWFGLAPDEARRLDPQQRLFLEVAAEALERASLGTQRRADLSVGVFAGASSQAYLDATLAPWQRRAAFDRLLSSSAVRALPAEHRRALEHAIDDVAGERTSHAATLAGNLLNLIAGRVAHTLGLRGPALVVDTACSSSLVAVHLACESLRRGECDVALAGGVALHLTPHVHRAFHAAGALSRTGACQPFSDGADGIVPGEGAAVVVLEPLSRARANGREVLAVVRGSAVNNDGRSLGIMAPNPEGQRTVLLEAYRRAGLAPERVSYVEAHGTGTLIGDPVEVRALSDALGTSRERALGAVKSNLGHLMAAAGVVGLLKAVLALTHRTLPPTLHVERENARLELSSRRLRVPRAPEPWEEPSSPRVAGVSAFGFGGTNCHVVVEEGPGSAAPSPADVRPTLLLLSAPTAEHLAEHAAQVVAHLEREPAELAGVAAALTRRTHHRVRGAATVSDASAAELRALVEAATSASVRTTGEPTRLALLFPGQGSQHVRQARGLLARWPTLRARTLELLDGVGARAAFDACWERPDDGALRRTDVAQPLLFAFQVSLAEALVRVGVRPTLALGHSVGEIAALACAGFVDVEEGLRWVHERGRVMQESLPEGAMAAVLAPEGVVAPLLAATSGRVGIAAVNGHRQTVIAGPPDGVRAVCQALEERDVVTRALPVAHAFHSPLVDELLPTLRESLPRLSVRPGAVEVISTVTAAPLTASDVDHGYLVAHARRTVRFADALRALAARDVDAFVEVGPGNTLARLTRALLDPSDARPTVSLCRAPSPVEATAHDDEQDVRAAYDTLASLYLSGVDLDLGAVEDAAPSPRAPLIPWRRERLRLDEEPSDEPPGTAPPRAPDDAEDAHLQRRVWRALHAASSDDRSAAGWLLDARAAGTSVLFVDDDTTLEEALLQLARWQAASATLPPGARLVVITRARPSLSAALRAATASLRVEGMDIGVVTLPHDVGVTDELVARALRVGRRTPDVRLLSSGEATVPALEPVDSRPPAPEVRGKAFVVLGGTGGVGGALARALARRGAARVVLVGRRDRAACAALLDELQALGASSALVPGDVRDASVLSRALTEACDGSLPLGGVVHAAGAARLGSLSSRTPRELEDVVGAKVRGAEALAQALVDVRYDFVALISSIAAVEPGHARGLVDYAAANAYLEGLAEEQRALGRPWLALAYPAWRQVGMATALGGMDVEALDEAHAVRAFDAALGVGLAQGEAAFIVRGTTTPAAERSQFVAARSVESVSPPVATHVPSPPPDLEAFLREAVARAVRRPASAIDPNASLVRLGLDSLAAVDIVKQLEERVGRKLTLTLLFEHDTIAKVVSHLEKRAPVDDASAVSSPSTSAGSLDGAPLLPAQQTFFANQGLLPHLPGYVFVGVDLEGPLSPPALERAVTSVWARHEVLRCGFGWRDGRPAHLLLDGTPPPLVQHDLREASIEEQHERALAIEHELRNRPFALESPPLARLVLLRRGERRFSLLLTLHHIAADAWSAHRLLDELLELHARLVEGDETPLPPLASTFADVARALADEGDGARESRAYWERALRDPPPPLPLPYDGDPEAEPTGPCELYQVALDEGELARLRDRAREWGVSLFDTVLASYARALREWSGSDDVIIRVANARREARLPDIERVIGCFADSLPVRLDANAPDLEALTRRARAASLDAMRHPFTSSLALAGLGQRSRGGPRGLTPAGLSFPSFRARERWGAVRATGMRGGSASGFTQLGLIAWESSTGLTLSWSYTQPLFRPPTIARMAGEHLDVLRMMATGGERRSPTPRTRALPAGRVLHERLRLAAERRPERVGVVDGARTLRYGELQERAARVASVLQERGVSRGDLVGVLAHPSREALVGVLGALGSGAAYVPADPDYPDERVRRIFTHARVRAVLTTSAQLPRLLAIPPGETATVVLLDDVLPVQRDTRAGLELLPWREVAGARLLPPPSSAPDDLAYVMYTSGTTGAPKGVMVTHDAVSRFHDWVHDAFDVVEDDRFIQTSALSFGGSIRQMFSPLLAGATVYPVARSLLRDPAALARFLDDNAITLWNSVPTLWRRLLEALEQLDGEGGAPTLDALRWILIGGEEVPADLPRRWRARFGAKHRVANLYGSTETVVNATWWEVGARLDDERHVPIGAPRAGSTVHVLDDEGRPAPAGTVGELYVGGPSLARGYLREPALTARAFVRLPDGGVGYRTGDLVRARSDGALVYVGRRDTLVKVRGNRVELGEIEAVVREDARVRQACVVEWRRDGHQRLVAFVEPVDEAAPPRESELRRRVSSTLPDYMMPHRFEALPRLPLTPAGKIDRRALLARLDDATPSAEMAAANEPRVRALEDAIASAFAHVLERPSVPPDGDFFLLGGDSILALDVVRRLREAGASVPRPMLLYAERTPRALARALAATSEQAAPSDAGEVTSTVAKLSQETTDLPLLPAQRGFLLSQALAGGRPPVLGARLPLRGEVDIAVLERALEQLARRHAALRTRFPLVDGVRRQRVEPRLSLPLTVVTDPSADGAAELRALAEASLDVERGPLVRLALLLRQGAPHTLVLAAHHAVLDAVSLAVLTRDLVALYEAELRGAPARLPALTSDLSEIVRSYSRPTDEGALGWWRSRFPTQPRPLLGPPSPTSPLESARAVRCLSRSTSRALDAALERTGRSAAALLLTAYARVLGRVASQREVVVGVARSGREVPLDDAPHLVGCFAAGLPVAATVTPGGAFRDDLERCAASLREHLAHGDVAPDELARVLPRDPATGLPAGSECFLSVVDLRRLTTRDDLPRTGRALDLDLDGVETTFAAEASGSRAFLVARLGREHRLALHARLDEETTSRLLDDVVRELQEGLATLAPRARGGGRSEPSERVDAAIVGYLPSAERLAALVGGTPEEVRSRARSLLSPDDAPVLVETTSTEHGRSAAIVLPLFADELPRQLSTLPARVVDAAALARHHGARVVSLAGLLPSLTGYGLHVAPLLERAGVDVRLTSGHAATACAVVATTLAGLHAHGRALSGAHLGVLGFGSIGQTALRLLVDVAGRPRALTVLDLAERLPALERPFSALLRQVPHARLLPNDAAALRDVDVLLCATSGGGLDPSTLPPGALVVDDSFPPALDVDAAWPLVERGALFAVDGGRLAIAGEPRALLDDPTAAAVLSRGLGPGMPGCRVESLLLSARPELPATLGLAAHDDVRRWWQALSALGIGAAPFALHGRPLSRVNSMVSKVST